MKTETFGFTVETAYGNKLPVPLTVSTNYEAYETYAEITSSDLPKEKDILNFVNAKAKASARASATTEALNEAGVVKPTLETSPEMRFNQMVKILVAGGIDEATAKQQATALTGITG